MGVIILCALLAVACAAKGGCKGKRVCKMVNTHVEGFNKCSAVMCKAGALCYKKLGNKLSCSKDGVKLGMLCMMKAVKKMGGCPDKALMEMKKHGMMGAKCLEDDVFESMCERHVAAGYAYCTKLGSQMED